MTDNNIDIPVLFVDLKKYRIRIHKNTLHSIGDPDYILLLVNPQEHTLAVLRSNRTDPRAHSMVAASRTNKKSFELYSRCLVKSLRDICSDWQDCRSYRLYGESIPNEGVARFHMSDAVALNSTED